MEIVKPDFEDIYREQYDRVYTYVYTLLLNKEQAEDVVQETFISAYRNFGTFDPRRGSLRTWLCGIAHNKAMDLLRSAAYRLQVAWPETLDVGEEDAGTVKLLEEQETVLYLYRHLSPEEREFLNMRYTMGLKDCEVAAVLGISEKTVNKRFQRLLKKCLGILSP